MTLHYTNEGQPICSGCSSPVERLEETEYINSIWTWNPQKKQYVKSTSQNTTGIRCFNCEENLSDKLPVL